MTELERLNKEKEDLKKLQDKIASQEQKIKEMQDKVSVQEQKTEALREKIAKREQKILDKTKAECLDVCLDAIVVGAMDLKARHGSIAPYTHGYYINSSGNSPIKREFCQPVTSKSFWDLPTQLYNYLTKNGWGYEDFMKLKSESDKLWDNLPKDYNPHFYEESKNTEHYLHGNYIANGYETDGFDDIVKGRCGGTYSSMTTSSQNDLSGYLILLKGYCLDWFNTPFSVDKEKIKMVSDMFERHGIDGDLSNMQEWAKRNPTRCMSDNPCYISREENQKNKDDYDIDR